MTLTRRPQALFAEEDLEDARRQLVLYGRDGLPVISRDGELLGWLTRADVLRALATTLRSSEAQDQGRRGGRRVRRRQTQPRRSTRRPRRCPATRSSSYRSRQTRRPAGDASTTSTGRPAAFAVAVTQGREIQAARPDARLHPGERVMVLAPAHRHERREPPTHQPQASSSSAHTPQNGADDALAGVDHRRVRDAAPPATNSDESSPRPDTTPRPASPPDLRSKIPAPDPHEPHSRAPVSDDARGRR